ncbi:MAG: EAL domain-containing protein [Nitrospiraceae bacterium]|nr:EAL domain-containing protein [Nitrospiraceae bacterium]MDA8089649.1 EAL domain-containing protein [Nitrospiraceae bacterium]
MTDIGLEGHREDRTLSRIALYSVLLAWAGIVLYIISLYKGGRYGILRYFLSMDQSCIRFRALTLLAPFALTVIAYLINVRAKLFEKNAASEKKLQQQALELERANVQLTQQALYDALTNLPNRSLFIDHLHKSLDRRERHPDYSFAVLFLDLDRFKVINDSLGHVIGDELLILVAQRLKKHIRSIDAIARFGGDEFAILLTDIKESSYAEDIAERLKSEMRSPFSIFGHEVFITLSIGILLSDNADKKKPDELLRDVDTAMYRAKAQGKACHVTFDPAMHAEVTEALRFETQLRGALDRQELSLYYQPIKSLARNKIVGFEALLRWHHPEQGLLTASQFIRIAEETGLILSIEPWVIRGACRQLKMWQTLFPEYRDLTVSVNVSSAVFSQPGFYGLIKNVLEETGLDGSCLRLEIIERTLIENPEPAVALIKRLRELNVTFDIDDFGTGYSALNYLRHFPIKGLKIDGSFINALTNDDNNVKIVRTIITLGNELGLDVIAEGVESVEQLDAFRTMKGEYAQGYHLSRPMESQAVSRLLAGDRMVPDTGLSPSGLKTALVNENEPPSAG